jgi:hypothetical protein
MEKLLRRHKLKVFLPTMAMFLTILCCLLRIVQEGRGRGEPG